MKKEFFLALGVFLLICGSEPFRIGSYVAQLAGMTLSPGAAAILLMFGSFFVHSGTLSGGGGGKS